MNQITNTKEKSIVITELGIKSEYIAQLADMIATNQISQIMVSQKLFPKMINNPKSPNNIASENAWIQENDSITIEKLVDKVINKYPEKVLAYKNGNTNLLGLFMGEIMRETKGKINPKSINEILKNKLTND